jgi:transaldolase
VQRLLWASTGTKDPAAPDTLYVEALAAPDTINTLPEKTLFAFSDHGKVRPSLQGDGNGGDATIAQCREAGIDIDALAEQLQREGAESFSQSWAKLLDNLANKATPSSAKTDP